MKKTTSFLLSLFVLTSMWAQDGTFNSAADADPEATKILDALEARFESNSSAKYDFDLEMEFPGQAVETMSGGLVQKGEKFVFTMGEQKIYSDEESIWIHDMSMNVVQIYDADFGEEGAFMSPTEFINIYKSKDYTYAITNEWLDANQSYTQIEFKPLDQDSEYFKIRLVLAGKNHDIDHIKVFAKDGSRYLLRIKSIDTKENFNDDYFVFNVENHKDIQVENLRID